jgi:lysine-N-methylase
MERVLPPEVFQAAVKRAEKPYALMVLGDDGWCRFLENKLCSLHARFGSDVLGDACASYPRLGSILGDTLEGSLELSCPEAARLLLLAEDSMELEPIDPALTGRADRRQVLTAEAQAGDPELARFAEARAQVLSLLVRREFPLSSRLFFVAYYADKRAISDDLLQPLHDHFETASLDASLAATILIVILSARLATRVPPNFRKLVDAAVGADLAQVGTDPTGDAVADLRALGPRRLLSMHRARRFEDARIDAYLERYCRHFFHGDWYLRSPSLLVHLNSLLVRLCAIRWLLFAHPLARTDPARAAVEVVYSFSRAVEHSAELSQTIIRALTETQTTTVAHAATLLRF